MYVAIGLIIGAAIGFFGACLCVAAREDWREQKEYEEYMRKQEIH